MSTFTDLITAQIKGKANLTAAERHAVQGQNDTGTTRGDKDSIKDIQQNDSLQLIADAPTKNAVEIAPAQIRNSSLMVFSPNFHPSSYNLSLSML